MDTPHRLDVEPPNLLGGFVAAFVIFLLLGFCIYIFTPGVSPQTLAGDVKLMVYPSLVRPEPNEHYTYFGLMLATPFILAASIVVAKYAPRISSRLTPIACWLGIAILLVLFLVEPFWWRLTSQLSDAPWSWEVAGGATLAVAALQLLPGKRFHDIATRFAMISVVVLGGVVEFCWRIFDLNTVTYSSWGFQDEYDAAIYSVAQISNGSTCLVDVIPQYGCYGEVMAPVLRILGISTLSITFLLSTLQLLAFLAFCAVARRLIRQPVLFIACVLLFIPVSNRIWYGSDAQYFQGLPVRLIFPVLSILVAAWWLRVPRLSKAALMGGFSGLAIFWNLDVGAVVAVALAALIAFSGCTDENWQRRSLAERAFGIGIYCLGVLALLFLIAAALRIGSGQWPNAWNYISFQQTFFTIGFGMLPMAPFPSLWTAFAGAAMLALFLMAMRVGRGPTDRELELLGFVAILSVGLISYYVGRSHTETLAFVSWPFILLILALIDRGWRSSLSDIRWSRVLGRIVSILGVWLAASVFIDYLPAVMRQTEWHWAELRGYLPPNDVAQDVAYIQSQTHPGEKVAILSKDQSVFFSETGLRSAIDGTGLDETLRVADALHQSQELQTPAFTQLFLGSLFCCTADALSLLHMPAALSIRQRFALVGWSPNGTMAHLVTRDTLGARPDLFAEASNTPNNALASTWNSAAGESLQDYGRPIAFPYQWTRPLGSKFHLEMHFKLDHQEPAYATIVSTYTSAPDGFVIMMEQPNSATFYFGNRGARIASHPFPLAPFAEHDLVLTSSDPGVRLVVDGAVVFDDAGAELTPSQQQVMLGLSPVAGRELRGLLLDLDLSQSQ